MIKGTSAISEAKKTFSFVIEHDFGITDELRCDCHAIYNVDLLFDRLQEKYSGNYREYLKAKRLFIDAWLGSEIDVKNLCSSVANFTNATDNQKPFEGILRWYSRVDEFKHSNNSAIVKLALNKLVNFAAIDALMQEVIYKLMSGMSLPAETEKLFAEVIFNEIFASSTGYYSKDITTAYSNFLREVK